MIIRIHFTEEAIVRPAMEFFSRETGASLEFLGVVRELENGSPLSGLHYEAYLPMATRRLEAHLADLGQLHRCDSVDFIHRLGWVPVGEASLWIRVQSAHRAEGLALMAKLIDLLKQDVPIWKLSPIEDQNGGS